MLHNKRAAHLRTGERAEQLARQYLIKQGLTLVCQNYRCKQGEIDLIMRDQNILVFVEVRYRKSDRYGSAVESITQRKQSRIITACNHYRVSHKVNQPIRFDVVTLSADNAPNWIKNAFQT